MARYNKYTKKHYQKYNNFRKGKLTRQKYNPKDNQDTPENSDNYVIIYDTESKDLNHDVLDNILEERLKLKRHNKNSEIVPSDLFLLFLQPIRIEKDRLIKARYYNVKTNLISSIDKLNCIANKWELNKNMAKQFPEIYSRYMMPTIEYTPDITFQKLKEKLNDGWFIARPLEMILDGKKWVACQGHGILYIKNQADIDTLKHHSTVKIEVYNKTSRKTVKKSIKASANTTTYILTSYIRNPLLYKGRKFQLRVFLILGYINNRKVAFVMDKSRIVTAGEKYTSDPNKFNSSSEGKAIHDTHFKTTDENAYFPMDFNHENITDINFNSIPSLEGSNRDKLVDSIMEQMNKIFKAVARIFFTTRGCAEKYRINTGKLQSRNYFKDFGADIMITDDFQVKLIEVNDKPAHNLHDKPPELNIPDYDIPFSTDYFQWMADTAIIPVYNTTFNKEIPLYQPRNPDRRPIYDEPMGN